MPLTYRHSKYLRPSVGKIAADKLFDTLDASRILNERKRAQHVHSQCKSQIMTTIDQIYDNEKKLNEE